MAHGYRVIIKFKDGSEDMTFEFPNEKVADSVVRSFSKHPTIIASVEKEEF